MGASVRSYQLIAAEKSCCQAPSVTAAGRLLLFPCLSKCSGHRPASHQVNLSLGEECLQQSALMMRLVELSWETEESHCMCRTGLRAVEDSVQTSAE